MAWRARQRSENRRAGGLKGRDRGWLPGSSQANAIGIPSRLVNTVRERTTTLVTREAAANIAGGLTQSLPQDFGQGDILIDTRSLVVKQNQLGGIGRFRSQFNVDADGIKYARYYLPITPDGSYQEIVGECKIKCVKSRPNSVISIDSNDLPGITTRIPQNIWTLREGSVAPVYWGEAILTPDGESGYPVYLYSISVKNWLSSKNWQWVLSSQNIPSTNSLNEVLFTQWWGPPGLKSFNIGGDNGAFANTGEETAYENVWRQHANTAQEWQELLTNRTPQITQIWIMTDNSVPMNTSNIAIFTKRTNNPIFDYSNLPGLAATLN